MSNYNEAVSKVFSKKEELIILGLTGRTGAGCSTVADILSKNYEDLDLQYTKEIIDGLEDEYKFNIIKEYIGHDDRWVPFTVIQGSCVILSYIFETYYESDGSSAFIDYLINLQSSSDNISFKIDNFSDLIKEIQGIGYIFKELQNLSLCGVTPEWENFNDDQIEKYYNLYINKMPEYRDRFKKILLRYSCYEEKKNKIQDEPPIKYHLYTYILQKVGNNIRASGNPYISELYQDKIFSFAERLDILINLIVKYDKISSKTKSRICIDAIRNANESNYLKDKYRQYYLFSISVDEPTRRRRLSDLDLEEQNSLDSVEYSSKLKPGELFYHQNIANCFEMADVHIVNENQPNGRKCFLTWQLVKYITLMIHPGLITPSHLERCMQLAYVAKYNSGCLSRQVGAVVTNNDYAIKAVGWNEVPQGQMSCNLRSIDGYCKGNTEMCYSQFEYENDEFMNIMKCLNESIQDTNLHGRKFSYCFKDVYNGYKGEKNQVYTRALHAEENAFLQVSKYGGHGIKGGILFCTASPCELCAKKAYQLGISDIYYIDPYPGISEKHILNFGNKGNNPKMHLFFGAIGEAYIQIYKPLFSYKDELELVSGVNCKENIKKLIAGKDESPEANDLLYHSVEFTIEFKDRETIESLRKVDIEVLNGKYQKLKRRLTWTGSSYDRSELIDNNEGYSLIDSQDKVSPYKYQILFNKEIKEKEHIKYTVKSYVKDETHMMHEYFAHMIKYPTEKLTLRVIIPKSNQLLENVRYVRYADMNMEFEYPEKDVNVKRIDQDDKIVYLLEINNPNLFYTYSIEWDFIHIADKGIR